MLTKYEFRYEDSQQIEAWFKQHGQAVEDITNDYLDQKGSKEIIDSIIEFMPVSKRNKKHAKHSNPLKKQMINLGVIILSKPKYGYLVFPNEGRGFRNPIAQHFAEKGLEKASGPIIAGLAKEIEINFEGA